MAIKVKAVERKLKSLNQKKVIREAAVRPCTA